MRHIPEAPIYCTSKGLDSLTGHYHQDWNFQVVKTGDTLSLGSKELVFIEAPMLHWPDSMMCYLTGDNILFSNDAFGQHIATELMYNDLVDQAELFQEAIKYYANILTPFSKLVDKKIKDVLALNVPVDMICPSHGVIWRDNPLQIVKKYVEWANNYSENQITVAYDTMWNGTRRMAEAIAHGIAAADSDVTVKLFNIARSDKKRSDHGNIQIEGGSGRISNREQGNPFRCGRYPRRNKGLAIPEQKSRCIRLLWMERRGYSGHI